MRWEALSVFPADFDEAAVAAVWCDGSETRKELTGLVLLALVEENTTTGRYRLHDLMRLVAAEAFEGHPEKAGRTERIQAAELRFAEHYQSVLHSAGRVKLNEDWAKYDREAVNILHSQWWADERADGNPEIARLFCQFALNGAAIYRFRLPSLHRFVLYGRCLAVASAIQSPHGIAHSHSNLGEALVRLGNLSSAREFFQTAAKMFKGIGDVHSSAVAEGRIAELLAGQGKLPEAMECYAKIKAVFEGQGDVREAAVAESKMVGLRIWQGKPAEAIDIHEGSRQCSKR